MGCYHRAWMIIASHRYRCANCLVYCTHCLVRWRVWQRRSARLVISIDLYCLWIGMGAQKSYQPDTQRHHKPSHLRKIAKVALTHSCTGLSCRSFHWLACASLDQSLRVVRLSSLSQWEWIGPGLSITSYCLTATIFWDSRSSKSPKWQAPRRQPK